MHASWDFHLIILFRAHSDMSDDVSDEALAKSEALAKEEMEHGVKAIMITSWDFHLIILFRARPEPALPHVSILFTRGPQWSFSGIGAKGFLRAFFQLLNITNHYIFTI
jgi:hypothetical protein